MSWIEAIADAIIRGTMAGIRIGEMNTYNLLDGSQPNVCIFHITASDGCAITVNCGGTETTYGAPMPQCYAGGVNSYSDPGVGPFTLTWGGGTDVYGYDDDSPVDPSLVVDYVDNGASLDCAAEADQTEFNGGSSVDVDGQTVSVKICEGNIDGDIDCGIPGVGANVPGLDSEGPVNSAGYAPGWCTFHMTQYQKPDPAVDSYSYDVTIFDNNQDNIGQVTGIVLPTDQTYDMTSKLPETLEFTSGAVDDDPVCFAYGDQFFCSNDQEHHCDFGAYDSGNRDGDCGFTCT